MNERTIVAGPTGPIEVRVPGAGPAVVLLASLGRDADDFAELASQLSVAGYRALAMEPRGGRRERRPPPGRDDGGPADDVVAVIEALAHGPATVAGHAFGNRVARMAAVRRSEFVESVVLLAWGGLVAPAPEVTAAMVSVFDTSLDSVERLHAVGRAFFAPGHDPSPWSGGWHDATAAAQVAATGGAPVEEWWAAGSADVPVIQPAADVVAVPAPPLDGVGEVKGHGAAVSENRSTAEARSGP
jgi:pimeloyl-ACP methyl ester carboxylesterase